MDLLALWMAGWSFAFLLAASLVLAVGQSRLARLPAVPRLGPGERRPRVSIIAPALNEERNVEQAVRSLLAQDYADFEVVLVDDRSTDRTPEILARLAAELPRLHVVTVRELPPGWLGKNHAMHVGAGAATGELLLFTDADVILAPDAHLERGGFDHVAAAPETIMPGLLNLFTLYFGLIFTLWTRPWRARDPRSSAHVGVGAFNLVRATTYLAAGGHERIRLRPDDDLKLGKIVKLAGGRQDFVLGRGAIAVEWYASWREVRDGLMKNLYAGAEYRTWLVTLGVLAHVFGLWWPVVAWAWTDGWAFWLNVGCLLLYAWHGAVAAREFGTPWWGGLAVPFMALFGGYLMARAAWLTLRNDGIDWRGTHYPLAALRSNEV